MCAAGTTQDGSSSVPAAMKTHWGAFSGSCHSARAALRAAHVIGLAAAVRALAVTSELALLVP